MVPGIVHRRFTSFDGTEIAYQVRGEGPAVVLANGLGGTHEAYRHVYDALGDRYKVVCWDYRGIYRSGVPRDHRTLAIPYHARDLELLLDREEIERAVFVGWSMGVQVNLEFFRKNRAKMAGIIAINGVAGAPFRTALAWRLSRYVIPAVLAGMKTQAALVSRLAHTAIGWQGLVPTLQRLGVVAPTLDVEGINAVAADFATLDWTIYTQILERLGEHDARDVLPSIDVPTLIITGGRDLMTPVFTARSLNRKIVGSRLVVIPGGTHYTPLEFPAIVTDEIRRFLAGLGWREPDRPLPHVA